METSTLGVVETKGSNDAVDETRLRHLDGRLVLAVDAGPHPIDIDAKESGCICFLGHIQTGLAKGGDGFIDPFLPRRIQKDVVYPTDENHLAANEETLVHRRLLDANRLELLPLDLATLLLLLLLLGIKTVAYRLLLYLFLCLSRSNLQSSVGTYSHDRVSVSAGYFHFCLGRIGDGGIGLILGR